MLVPEEVRSLEMDASALRPCGDDRLESGDPLRPVLVSRWPKGWRARVLAVRPRPEHPGTAVLWGDRRYEVVAAETLADGSVRYRLALWEDRHVMRHVETYDERAEARRREERDHAFRDRRYRLSVYAAALLAGHLPASVQHRLDEEYDISAATLTFVSAAPLFAAGAFCAIALTIRGVAGGDAIAAGIPTGLLVLGLYFFVESGLRLSLAVQGEPCGSLAGHAAWALWTAMRNRS
jgi:hypothetical protein